MILWSIELKSCFTSIICEQKLNHSSDTNDCERSEAKRGLQRHPRGTWRIFFHNVLFDHTNYVISKGLEMHNVKCSLALQSWFLIRCAIMVSKYNMGIFLSDVGYRSRINCLKTRLWHRKYFGPSEIQICFYL